MMKNLNYAKISTPRGDEVGVENNVGLILTAIAAEPKITQKKLALKTGLSIRTVSREVRGLRDSGAIRRIGSDRLGHWEIIRL
jgi:predicted HTH transcriptional regulator